MIAQRGFKCRLDGGLLFRKLRPLMDAVPARAPTDPALLCLYFEVKDGALFVTATNSHSRVRRRLFEVRDAEEGFGLVEAKGFDNHLKLLKNEEFVLSVDEDSVCVLEGEGFRTVVPGDESLLLSDDGMVCKSANEVLIPGQTLASMFDRVKFCTGDPSRYMLHAVLFRAFKDKLRLIATDGRRFAAATVPVGTARKKGVQCLVPGEALGSLTEFLASVPEEDKALVRFDARRLGVAHEDNEIRVRLVKGGYVPYDSVLKLETDFLVRIERSALLTALTRASANLNPITKSVKMEFRRDSLKLSSKLVRSGTSDVTVPVVNEGDPFEIGFNPHHMRDVVTAFSSEEVVLNFTAEKKIAVITEKDDSGVRYRYVLSPVQLG